MYMRDDRVTEYIMPVKISGEKAATDSARLLSRFEGQIYLNDKDCCTLSGGGYLLLDFGRELHGGVRIITEDGHDGADIRLRFGESVGEACSDIGENGATNDHSPRDFRVTAPRLSDLTWGQTGFRFVRIDNLGKDDYKFTNIVAAYVHRGEEYKGRFTCSDPLVNKIYDTAAYTLYLNMQNRLWDGIKRDRLVWTGDMHPEVKGILSLYGAHPLVESALKESAEHNPAPQWITGIPTYSVWWLAVLCDYEWYTGNSDFAADRLPYVYAVLDMLDKSVSAGGEVDFVNAEELFDKYFLNWETCGEEGRECGARGLLLWTLEKCAAMLVRLKKDPAPAKKIAARISANNSFAGRSKAVAALYALGYGVHGGAKDILTAGGAEGYSCFMSSYIMNALADIGQGERAVREMKEFYGGMLSRGATTFWESFDLSWLKGSGRIDEPTPQGLKDIHCTFGKYCYNGYRLSLCHGWACGPVPFLSERVLGVKFTAPGGERVMICPDLMGLEYAEGAVPTKFGKIEIRLKKKGDKVSAEYDLPSGVTLEK